MKLLIPALLLAGLAAAPSTGRDRNDVPVAIPTGPAVDCVPISRLRDSQVRSDRVIDFMTGPRRGYRVTLDDACPQLGFDRAFSYSTSISQLCRQDIITVLHTGSPVIRGASCGLASFQPIELPRRR